MKYLLIKRFAMDDVPVLLTDSLGEADRQAKEIESDMESGDVHATKAEQDLMELDIGTELISVGIVTFGEDGKPISAAFTCPE